MRQLLFICSILLILSSCGQEPKATSGAELSADLTGFEITEISGSDLKRAVKKEAQTGAIEEEGTILNGQKHGTWITYYTNENHRPKTIAGYVNGALDGLFVQLSDRGNVELEAQYRGGRLNGRWTKYRFGSRPERQIEYINDVQHGYYREFHNNGKLQKEAVYKNGKLDGKFVQYNEEQEKIIEYDYKDGEKLGGGIVTPK